MGYSGGMAGAIRYEERGGDPAKKNPDIFLVALRNKRVGTPTKLCAATAAALLQQGYHDMKRGD